eukprot:TRINITY_DN53587_c0_g1_i1.p1 TRINITY_DN53587_c0_g1~~TRINITY_DN53587_c0_g1_i1.p1  ORF type:complete len:726 (-),score=64.17 TRINITY_DN53587_c0_g1_i1:582-2699(-)
MTGGPSPAVEQAPAESSYELPPAYLPTTLGLQELSSLDQVSSPAAAALGSFPEEQLDECRPQAVGCDETAGDSAPSPDAQTCSPTFADNSQLPADPVQTGRLPPLSVLNPDNCPLLEGIALEPTQPAAPSPTQAEPPRGFLALARTATAFKAGLVGRLQELSRSATLRPLTAVQATTEPSAEEPQPSPLTHSSTALVGRSKRGQPLQQPEVSLTPTKQHQHISGAEPVTPSAPATEVAAPVLALSPTQEPAIGLGDLSGKDPHDVAYGTVVVLGYRDITYDEKTGVETPRGRMNEDFVMRRRRSPNGIRSAAPERPQPSARHPGQHHRVTPGDLTSTTSSRYTITMTLDNRALANLQQHRASPQNVVISLQPDSETDLFQFGRRGGSGNDWQIPGKHYGNGCGPVSRYAFRILANRESKKCSLFAGGFDEKGDLFLNQKTIRWGNPPHDAFTTYGVMLWTPESRVWREVSVLGNVYELRPSQEVGGLPVPNSSNELTDGSLISIGGTTMLFRAGDYSQSSALSNDMLRQLGKLQKERYQCPVQMCTINFAYLQNEHSADAAEVGPGSATAVPAVVPVASSEAPLVFPNCGHVFNAHEQLRSRSDCPCCRVPGPGVSLRFGSHRALAISPTEGGAEQQSSTDRPTHVFNPCGHATTEDLASWWTAIAMPGMGDHIAGKWLHEKRLRCPFCGVELDSTRPAAKLFFP